MLKGLKTKKTQYILLGMMIILLSLIAIIDLKGYIGGILSYIFVFLFGDFFVFPILLIMYLGIMLIKDQKIKINIPYISLYVILLCLVIYNSKSEWTLSNVSSSYIEMFNRTLPPFFKEYSYGSLNGGFIGFYLFSLFKGMIGKNGVDIMLLIIFIMSFMLALKPFINMFVNMFYDLDEKQEKKKQEKKNVTFEEYDEIKKEEPLSSFNPSFTSNINVTDLTSSNNINVNDEFSEKEHNKATLFTNLTFKKKNNETERKEDMVRSFNVFNDDLGFSKQETNLFNKPSVTVSEEPVYKQEAVYKQEEPQVKNEDIPSFNQYQYSQEQVKEESLISENKEEIKPEVKVSSNYFGEIPPSNDIEEEKEEYNDYIPAPTNKNSMNIFKTSINENKEVIAPIEEEVKEEVKPVFAPKPEPVNKHPYVLPSINLLKDVENEDDTENRMEAEVKGVRLNQKLTSLGINAKVVDFVVAPSFTRFQIEVASDVKLSVFNNIKQDVMMALSAEKINILAPIPGTPYVGIEIPNVKRSVVSFKEVFKDIPYKQKNEKLLAVLGKDITGNTVTIKINDTPHLLIAGATGSGKSVCINTIIASLLMRTSYEDVKLILVDPKRVELGVYADVPHLLCPVINDPIKATLALNKVAEIMDERYAAFNNEGSVCRNIEAYNRIVTARGEKPLPYIVMIIDELSDLMLVAGKDVESSILRITQLARACGIHLIVATQRPSVDVVTGIIKANLPSRIAFAVSTSADSRTILDQGGAEDLLGRGDSLVSLRGELSMSRVQGAYVSDEEIENIVGFVSKQRKPVYDPRFLNLEPKPVEDDFSCEGLATDEDDDLYDMILNFVKTQKTISTTALQIHFKMGYPKARRMIDLLEENGAISGPSGSKGRTVLINNME